MEPDAPFLDWETRLHTSPASIFAKILAEFPISEVK
jgi:hypothetical protein